MKPFVQTDKAAIQATIMSMNQVAREAARLFTIRLLENPSIQIDQKRTDDAFLGAFSSQYSRYTGIDPIREWERFNAFVEQHGNVALNVAASVIQYIHLEGQRKEKKKKWVKIGAATAVIAGIVAAPWALPALLPSLPFIIQPVSTQSSRAEKVDQPLQPRERELIAFEQDLLKSFFGEGN